MRKRFTLMVIIFLIFFISGCNNEKGNNIFIGVEGENAKVVSIGDYSREDQLTLINNLYIGLFEVREGNKIVPILAESFSYSENGKIMYIKVKEGLNWSDGSQITVNDVAMGLKNNITGTGKYSYQYGYLDKMIEENIKVNDDGTLEIHLAKSFTDFEKVLAMPIFYPVLNPENPLVGPFSGDYVIEKNATNSIVLVPLGSEGKKAEELQGITASITFEYGLEKDKLIKGYQEKKYDIIFPNSQLSELKGSKIDYPGVTLLWINSRNKELNNQEARNSLYQSIDKISGIYPSEYRIEEKYPRINLTGTFEFQEKNLTLLVLDSEKEKAFGEKIKNQLEKKKDLEIELVVKNSEDYLRVLKSGEFDLALETFVGDYHGKNAYFELYKNPVSNPLNVSGVISPEINALQNAVNVMADSDEREQLFYELENKIINLVLAIVISEGVEQEIYVQRVKNVGIDSIYKYHDYSEVKY